MKRLSLFLFTIGLCLCAESASLQALRRGSKFSKGKTHQAKSRSKKRKAAPQGGGKQNVAPAKPQFDFGPIAKMAEHQFCTRKLPAILNKFSTGGGSSAAFYHPVLAWAALQYDLAVLEMKLKPKAKFSSIRANALKRYRAADQIGSRFGNSPAFKYVLNSVEQRTLKIKLDALEQISKLR